jgi:RNA polymerase-binding transcription factor DksA
MTKDEMEEYRKTLLAMRKRLNGDLSNLADHARGTTGVDANAGSATAPADPTDLGSDSYEQEFNFSLLQNQEFVLEEIGDALERVEKGSFGRCEECDHVIPKPRLQALPYTRHCVACARKLQQRS